MKFRLALAFAVVFAAATAARAEPTAAGFWEAQDSDGHPTAWFLFTDKKDVFSARLVKGFKPVGEEDKPPKVICTECPGKKKGAHIMGLTLFWGMKRDGLTYTDGSVLDPRDGSVYHAKMYLSEDGQELKVRGYIGIEMLGQTQTWHRLPDDAMKKEEVPKESLAIADDASGDKPKHAHKSKSDKPKAATLDATESPEATPTADPTKADPTKDAQ